MSDFQHQPLGQLRQANEPMMDSREFVREVLFSKYTYLCPVADSKQTFAFDYGIHTDTGRPRAVFQRVLILRQPSINNAAFMFQGSSRQRF